MLRSRSCAPLSPGAGLTLLACITAITDAVIPGLPYGQYVRGINYGGRFIPERWMDLPGMTALYQGVAPVSCTPQPCDVSLCDVAVQSPDAGRRMLDYLNASIQLAHFEEMKQAGFSLVRLPLGYWNLVRVYPVQGGPNVTNDRWNSLADMAGPEQYRPFVERVMRFAQATGLRVLLDLHGLPGGQSTNQYTGCATACQSAWDPVCPFNDYYFANKYNLETAVHAVTVMAQICQSHIGSCYGIELLNEPSPEPAVGNLAFRGILLDFYKAAIQAARVQGQLDPAVPIVLMDFPWYLATYWNIAYRQITDIPNAGTIMWETHIYAVPGKQVSSLADLERNVIDLQLGFVKAFTLLNPGTKLFLGEYALDQLSASVPLADAAQLYYNKAITPGGSLMGLAVWNYDGPAGWGAIRPNPGSNPQNLTHGFWSELNAKVPRNA